MYVIWLIVIFLCLRALIVWLIMPFAFFLTSTSRILLFNHIPNDRTILFLGSSIILLFPNNTSLSSFLTFVFIISSFDLEPFISISFILKNSSAISKIFNSCVLLFAIHVVSSAYAIAAWQYFVILLHCTPFLVCCSTI